MDNNWNTWNRPDRLAEPDSPATDRSWRHGGSEGHGEVDSLDAPERERARRRASGGARRRSGGGSSDRRRSRRRASAGATLLAMLLGFFVAGLLDVGAIERDIQGKPLGAARSIQLALLKPMVVLSEAVGFDEPAIVLNAMLGRDEREHHKLTDVTPEIEPKWPRTATADKPLRLLIVGDSMAQATGPSIKNLSEEAGVIKAKLDYKVSSGLSRPDFFDWPQHMIDQLIDVDQDATVVIFGANDAQDFKAGGKVLRLGSGSWRHVYQQRVGEAMDILTRNSRRVYWLGNPIMREGYFSERMAMINELYEAEAKRHPGVQYIPTWDLLADERGRYAQYLRDGDGDLTQVRGADGIHMTRAGADIVAARILEAVRADWLVSTGDGT